MRSYAGPNDWLLFPARRPLAGRKLDEVREYFSSCDCIGGPTDEDPLPRGLRVIVETASSDVY
jgi:hypothetical protein